MLFYVHNISIDNYSKGRVRIIKLEKVKKSISALVSRVSVHDGKCIKSKITVQIRKNAVNTFDYSAHAKPDPRAR